MLPIPHDVTHRIAEILHDDGYVRTVGALRLLDRATSLSVDPVFFHTLVINGRVPYLRGKEHHVRYLVIDCASAQLGLVLNTTRFPRVHTIELSAATTDSLRTWSDTGETLTGLPPILDWLVRVCSPIALHIRFPLVSSCEWAAYRDESTRGQYQLVARLSRLTEPELWGGCLKELVVHDIVHQVMPSVRGVRNMYHFADHIGSDPTGRIGGRSGENGRGKGTTRGTSLPVGPASTGYPGPEWNYRAWQITTAIKHLFPSVPTASTLAPGSGPGSPSPTPADTLATTSWTFCNTAGHVLTKDDRDDDDSSGVEYTQVESLVKDLVENGLKLDLPAREGFEVVQLDRLFQRIAYLPEEQGEREVSIYRLDDVPA